MLRRQYISGGRIAGLLVRGLMAPAHAATLSWRFGDDKAGVTPGSASQ